MELWNYAYLEKNLELLTGIETGINGLPNISLDEPQPRRTWGREVQVTIVLLSFIKCKTVAYS